MSSAIGFHPFVEITQQYGGPKELVEFFMNNVEDEEEKISIAKRYGLWAIAIQSIIKIKDKEQLQKLRSFLSNKLPPDESAPFRNQIDDALNNPKLWGSFSLKNVFAGLGGKKKTK